MKVGIDFRYYLSNVSGVGTYTRGIINAIHRINKEDIFYLYNNKENPEDLDLGSNSVALTLKQNINILWLQCLLPYFLLKHKVDIYHGLCNFEMPVIKSCPYITTIHDLIPVLYPDMVPFKNRVLFNRLIKSAVNRSDRIIAVSESTKGDLINYLGVNGDKIAVIYNGVEDRFRPSKDQARISDIKNRYGVDGDYIYFIGMIEPKKNLERLIYAFNILVQKREFKGIKLVISGQKGWYYNNIFNLVKELKLDVSVIFTGYVEDTDLPFLYSGASIFVFPSIYEGFGLPVAEALACGIPVVCSNQSSLPEIAEKGGYLIDPLDIDSIYNGMEKVLKDNDLKMELVKSGLARASCFDWDKSAKDTIAIYKTLV